MFALIDCNNFYASCQRVFIPDLKNKPIIVLSNNDGCVIARSNEAKAIGIKMGQPLFECKTLVDKYSIEVFSSNYALYGDMSNRVFSLIKEYLPMMEVYSIDEAFFHIEDSNNIDLDEFGREIVKKIQKCTGIPISIGFAPTKSLAKVANKIAKKFPQRTMGTYVIDSTEKQKKALKWTKVEDVWGIGRRYSKKLIESGIKNALDFTMIEDSWVKKFMSVVGLRLKQDLKGIPTIEIEDLRPKKTIATTRSFEITCTEFEDIKERIVTFAVVCAEKLRKQKSFAGTIMVFLHTNFHNKTQEQYSKSYVYKLPFATNSSIELAKFAIEALEKIFIKGYNYKKAGVVVMDLEPMDNFQYTLFQASNPTHQKLMSSVDYLNSTYGYQKVRLASQSPGRVWKMNQERLSPQYTTKLDEIIIVKA